MAKKSENNREHYRIVYPVAMRPYLLLSKIKCEIMNLSERGIKLVTPKGFTLNVGEEIEATIIFHDGEKISIKGQVLRTIGQEVVLLLSTPIPLKKIMLEQRILIQKFKKLQD